MATQWHDLAQIGEFGLIDLIQQRFSKNLPSNVEGIGDDCAVIPGPENLVYAITTDLLVEGIHFLREEMSPRDLGYKTLAVNLSDVAAMGAKPLYCFLSLAVESHTPGEWIKSFFDGFEELCRTHQVHLIGGDTTRSKSGIFLSVTAVGVATRSQIRFRNGARKGDWIAVTSSLGDSALGLKLLLEKKANESGAQTLLNRHFRPRPHVDEGQWMGFQTSVHSLMDVSDGLDSDLRHILKASGCGAKVYLEKIPLSQEFQIHRPKLGKQAMDLALAGGEDYCLLLTLDPREGQQTCEKFLEKFGRPLHVIGEITGSPGELNYLENGKPFELSKTGFDHFKKA